MHKLKKAKDLFNLKSFIPIDSSVFSFLQTVIDATFTCQGTHCSTSVRGHFYPFCNMHKSIN